MENTSQPKDVKSFPDLELTPFLPRELTQQFLRVGSTKVGGQHLSIAPAIRALVRQMSARTEQFPGKLYRRDAAPSRQFRSSKKEGSIAFLRRRQKKRHRSTATLRRGDRKDPKAAGMIGQAAGIDCRPPDDRQAAKNEIRF